MEFKHQSVLLEETIRNLRGKTGWDLCRWNIGRRRTFLCGMSAVICQGELDRYRPG